MIFRSTILRFAPTSPIRMMAFLSILLISFLIRLIFLIPPVRLDAADAQLRYDPIARNLLKGNGFSESLSAPYSPTNASQPAYPLFLAFVYRVTNFNLRLVATFQTAFELGSIFLLYLTAGLMGYSRKAKVLTVTVALLCPLLPRFSREILTEVIAVFTTMLCLYTSMRAVVKPRLLNFALSGIAAGFCLLVRSDLLPVVFLLILSIAFISKNKGGILMLLGMLALTLLPWTIRNIVSLRSFTPIDHTVRITSDPYIRWLDTWLTSESQKRTYLFEATPDRRIDYDQLREKAIHERPIYTRLEVPLIRLGTIWLNLPSKLPTSFHLLWMRLFVYALLILSIAGLYYALKSKRAVFLLPLCLIAGRSALPLLSSLAVESRYLYEALPGCFLFAGYGLSSITRRFINNGDI